MRGIHRHFSNGSERSRLCAEKYNVNLYTSIDKIPEDIDIVFIAVRTGVMGGDGSELALKFLSKGIHVFIEQPIHIDEMKKCVKCSIEKGVFFHVANFISTWTLFINTLSALKGC